MHDPLDARGPVLLISKRRVRVSQDCRSDVPGHVFEPPAVAVEQQLERFQGGR
jgi:hypothetical protein